MARCRARVALTGLILAASLTITGQGQALDVRCERGHSVRDVEVRFAHDADGLPCEVTSRTTLGSEQRELVWRNDAQLDFCTDKARELVHQLIDSGWTCESEVTAYASRPAPVPAVPLDPAVPGADAALPVEPEPGPDSKLAPSARPAPAGPRPDHALLRSALARDMERLEELAGSSPGSFRANVARLGDLDGDGVDEAVALLTHRGEGAVPRLRLLAYRFDGETFQPVARLALTETSTAQIQGIVDGVIEVVTHQTQPGDPACCPSGRRHASFVLRDHELVRLPEHEPGK